MDNINRLETAPIGKLLWEFAIPCVVGQVVASVYNIVDRIFLGQYVGAAALGGLAITLPIMNIIHAFGSLVGAGSAARMSIVLGRKDITWAEKILGNSVWMSLFFGVLFLAISYGFMNPILTAFGASVETIGFAREYMYIVLPGMFLVTLSLNLTGLIRSSGYPIKATIIMAAGAVLNIILDAIFIPLLGWGISGAAWATTISMFGTSVAAIWHFVDKGSFIHFKKHCWTPKFYIFRNVLAIGISPFSMNVAASLVVALLNKQLITYGGDHAVATYGVVNSFSSIVFMVMFGVCQGMQPIAGYNYGARKNDRLKHVYTLTMKVSILIGLIGSVISMLFPYYIVRCFTDDANLLVMGQPALRYLMVMSPFIGFTVTNSQFFQSIDKPWIAIVTSLSRQVLFLIPLIYLVPTIVLSLGGEGLSGVWMACTISDVLGAVLAATLLISQRKVFRADYVPPVRKPRKELKPNS